MPDSTRQSRQLPGNACDECRRRKLRCDRKRPRCGACGSTPSVPCNITEERVPRGPKKGSISAIRNRIVALEKRLNTSDTNTASSNRTDEQDQSNSYGYQSDLTSPGYISSTAQSSQDSAYAWAASDSGSVWNNDHTQIYNTGYDTTQSYEAYSTYPHTIVTSPHLASPDSTQYYATDYWGEEQTAASSYGNPSWDGYSTKQ